jgi:ABC-2 type transport system ATP-binding protein
MSFGLEGVTVRFGSAIALDDVSISVEPGEVAVVVGGDGAGKTTLARTLVGLVSPGTGSVRRPERRHVGYQPSSSGAWPDLTVAENLGFVASAHHLTAPAVSRRMAEVLELTGLTAARDRLGAHLSGGMRQKLGVAMALFSKPELLVLDEPTTGVDPVSRFDLWRLVSETAAGGTAVVMTTTYLDEAERAGTILALDAGRALAEGTPAEVTSSLRGAVFASDRPIEGARQWRRGARWRVWTDGPAPAGTTPVVPDLGDVLVSEALAAEAARP